MEKELEKEKNMMVKEKYHLKENIQEEGGMALEKNFIGMVN